MKLDDALRQAVAHHQVGRLQEAEQLYRGILRAQPNHPDANHNLGVVAMHSQQVGAALGHFKAALEANPSQGQYWLSYIGALIQTGQFDSAKQMLEQGRQRGLSGPAVEALASRLQPTSTTAPAGKPGIAEMQSLASMFSSGQFEQAIAAAEAMTQRFPDDGFGWKVLGAVHKQLGQNEKALEPMLRSARLAPQDVEAHANLGATQLDLGRLDEAEVTYRRVLQLSPTHSVAHCNLGTILRQTGRLGEAEQCYRTALQLDPAFADAHFNLGNTLRELGRFDQAEASYRTALHFQPGDADTWTNLGALLRQVARGQQAVDSYRRAATIAPDLAETHNNLGVALQDLEQFDEAQTCFHRALNIKPDFAEAHNNLGAVLQNVNRTDDARASYRKAYELGFYGARIKAALMLPTIMGTQAEVAASRHEFERGLDELIADNKLLDDVAIAGCATNFYLAYHGEDDRRLQVKVAKYFEQACPSLLQIAQHCRQGRRPSNDVKRIGFYSKYLTRHSVSLCFSKILETMASQERFDVTLLSTQPVDIQIQAACGGQAVQLPTSLPHARTQIADLELDVLVYLDVGMDPFGFFVAFARLAPVQCVLGGHPVTTGITNLDYFISSELMEASNAQEHYSEKLVRLPTPLFYFERPKMPERFKSRGELGLPNDRHLYVCPMRLQKLHPEFDQAITDILRADPHGVVVLFEDLYLPQGKALLERRFAETMPLEVRDRVLFLPWQKDPNDFMSVVALADVILDPFHFGIGSTTALTCAVGTPIVTRPAQFMRGRVGSAYCQMLDLGECIATDTPDYVQKAVQIASDASLRERLRTKILRNNPVFYGNMKPVNDFIDFVDRVAVSHAPSGV